MQIFSYNSFESVLVTNQKLIIMKKIIAILLTLIVTINSHGQNCSVIEYFHCEPAYVQLQGQLDIFYKGKYVSNDENLINYLNKHTYSFEENGKLYMVSYEPCDECVSNTFYRYNQMKTRNLYLYRLDNDGWKVASNKPLQTDYRYLTSSGDYVTDNYISVREFDTNKLSGWVMKQKDGFVEIRLLNYYFSHLSEHRYPVFYNSHILIKSNGNETYTVISNK